MDETDFAVLDLHTTPVPYPVVVVNAYSSPAQEDRVK
jgi:hypothetical protein